MTRIYLIRHGETEWNRTGRWQGTSDVLLSPAGIRQAQLWAEHAPFTDVDAIYSSDLSRAIKTAEILADRFSLPVIEERGFRETNFGDWEGGTLSELLAAFPDDFGKFFVEPDQVKPPNGEIFSECQARAMTALEQIVAVNADKKIVIVSHGLVIRLILCAVLSMPIRKVWAISQSNTAVNIIRVDDGNATVELVNGTSHLQNF